MHRKCLRYSFILVSAFIIAGLARADGPHWQVPDPGPLYDPSGSGRPKPPAPAPPAQGKGNKPYDYTPHVPDILKLNDECVKWYEKHCVIKFSDKKKFYLDIMARCAQAMREVDEYCPCPDSYPLWHTEELRDLLVKYSQDTWVKVCTEADQEFAQACIVFCVNAYCDTVRFGNDPDLVKKSQAIQKKLQEMAEKGDLKGGGGFKQAIAPLVVKKVDLDTFKFVTGDIPLCVETAQSRMWQALHRMGKVINPALIEAQKTQTNAAAQKALKDLYMDLNPEARPKK